MAQSKKTKRLFNMAYGFGASIVILGALFKILHWEIGFLNGGLLLAIGLIVEAIIFAISAFEPTEEDLDWSLVYPELAGGEARKKDGSKEAEGILSKKLDQMLKEAKVDAELMGSLGESIRNFEDAAKNMGPTTDAVNSTKKYSEELSLAATQMESLNSLYKVQLENAAKQTDINEEVASNASKLKEQMQSLATNLGSLNGVYGGMLSAMAPPSKNGTSN